MRSISMKANLPSLRISRATSPSRHKVRYSAYIYHESNNLVLLLVALYECINYSNIKVYMVEQKLSLLAQTGSYSLLYSDIIAINIIIMECNICYPRWHETGSQHNISPPYSIRIILSWLINATKRRHYSHFLAVYYTMKKLQCHYNIHQKRIKLANI